VLYLAEAAPFTAAPACDDRKVHRLIYPLSGIDALKKLLLQSGHDGSQTSLSVGQPVTIKNTPYIKSLQ